MVKCRSVRQSFRKAVEHYDAIVIGGGVIGTSIACHLARLGAKRTLLLERGRLGGGTTAQSSCILRTHYSVRENVVLAQAAMRAFDDFAGYLGDAEAAARAAAAVASQGKG